MQKPTPQWQRLTVDIQQEWLLTRHNCLLHAGQNAAAASTDAWQ
jgi:hypothetical protein